MASIEPDDENIIEFNIGELGVAGEGGSVSLDCNGVKCRLDIPKNLPVGTNVRINFKASEINLKDRQIGLTNFEEFHQPSTLMNTNLIQAEENKYQPSAAPKKKWDGTMNAEQQLVLASIIIGVVGLGVGVGILSQNTSLWEKPGVGASVLLCIIFAAFIAAIESGFASVTQLPLIESVASIISTFIIFSLFLSFDGYGTLWLLGGGLFFLSIFHAFHVRSTHKKYKEVSPSSWFSTRLVLLFTPFVFLWFGIILSFGWGESSKPFLLMAASGAYALVSVGTLAPTFMYLDDTDMQIPTNPLKYFAQQENALLLWVLLNGLTVSLVALKGGARLHAPIAQFIPASFFFIAVSSPFIPSYPSPLSMQSSSSKKAKEMSTYDSFKQVFEMQHRPRGIASIILALFCLMICIGSRSVAGNQEPSAALASFAALLVGTVSHHIVESEELEAARIGLAAVLLVCSFWTGRYSSIFTEAFACLIWGSLQLPMWHDLMMSASKKSKTSEEGSRLKARMDGAGGGVKIPSKRMSLNPMHGVGGGSIVTDLSSTSSLHWYEKSLKPWVFFTGIFLCMASFVLTDWIDRVYNASAQFLIFRGLFSISIPPLVGALANLKRSERDTESSDAGDCILIALTLPLLASFCSSGPWFENTKILSFVYSIMVLVSIRLTNHSEIWSSRNIHINLQYLDYSVYALFGILCLSCFSHLFFNMQLWVMTLFAFLSAGPEGIAFKNSYFRIAMFRPPIIGSILLFLFAIMTDGYRARNDDTKSDLFITCLPLLLFLPLFFITCGIGGRVYSGVTLKNLRFDIALASIYFALCCAPFAAFVVSPEIDYKYEDDDKENNVKSSWLPYSSWTLMSVIIFAMVGEFILLKLTPNVKNDSIVISNTSTNNDKTSLVENGESADDNAAPTFQSLSSVPSGGNLLSSSIRDSSAEFEKQYFDGRDTLVSGGLAFMGSMSVELPLALALGSMLGVVYARDKQCFHGAVLATFIFLCRGSLQLFDNLYGFSTMFWLLMLGCFMLFLVALWPMPDLMGTQMQSNGSSGSNLYGNNLGAIAAFLRVCFVAACVMMVGPATEGWGSLIAIICFTAVYVYSTESGILRAAVFTPLLYFGSFAMIIYHYNEEDYLVIASLITSSLALVCGIVLRFVGKDGNNEAVSHFMIYFIFMPFGLGCTSDEFNYVPIIVSFIVTIWAYCHITKHTSAAVFLVSVIPFIVLVSVANLVTQGNTETSKLMARGMLAFVAGLWGVKLVIVYYVLKVTGILEKTVSQNKLQFETAVGSSPNSNGNVSTEFQFSRSFAESMLYVNMLGNGCMEQFNACGALWLLASFVFLNGYPSLIFGASITLFIMIRLYLNNTKWWVLILGCSIAVTTAAFVIDVGTGLIWTHNFYGACAIVSVVSFPLPWLITFLTWNKNNDVTLSLSPFIACVLIIPFGFVGSYATNGVLAILSVFIVMIWTSLNPFYASFGCAILPNFAIVAGAMLRHGGKEEMLLGDKIGSVLPGGAMVVVGLYFILYGTLIAKKQHVIKLVKAVQEASGEINVETGMQDAATPFYLDWVPDGFMQKCGAFTFLLGTCYMIAGMVGVVAMFLLTLFVGGASMLEKKSEGKDEEEAVVTDTGIASNDQEEKDSNGLMTKLLKTKHEFVEGFIFLFLLATAMAVAYGENCMSGVMPSNISAVAAMSGFGLLLVILASIVDRKVESVPWHVRDFLMYLWFVIGGLIGAQATKGSLGVIVIIIGSIYSFTRNHSLICVFVSPCLMFWAGKSLNHATGNVYPCMAIGLPVLIYAVCELIAAQILKCTNTDVLLKGPGSIPISWANPKELVPRYFSSALEISGALFLIAGSMGLMYCPGDNGGQLGVGGQLGFIGLLVLMGIYLLRTGLILRDEEGIANLTSSDGIIGAKAQGLRLRIVGLLLINAAIWFAFPLTSSNALKAVVVVLGSMVLIISGCASMYWKKDVDNEARSNQEANARNESQQAANAL